MPLVDVPWPASNAPGFAPGEGAGRLINCFTYKEGQGQRWRALPGTRKIAITGTLPAGELRGAVVVGSQLYLIIGIRAVQIGADLTVTLLDGTVLGTGPVTMQRNNNVVPDIAIVTSRESYIIASPVAGAQQSVTAYPDGNVPFSNSIAFLDGYFLFTTRDGFIYASNLNTTASNPLSFAKAEARPDGLLRGIVYGLSFLAFGDSTIEVWQDAGTLPFPLARQSVIACGLKAPWAVAGAQDGWTEDLIFVAADNSVRRLVGYDPQRISPVELDRLIEQVADPNTLIASVYTFGSNAIWSLSSPTWTWEYNVTTGAWHERESASLSFARWRATLSVKHPVGWIFGDLSSASLLTLDDIGLMDAGDPMTWGMDSGPVKQFPARIQVPDVTYDFVLGQAPQGVDPGVLLSWSHDGGARWSNPLRRSLGRQGIGVAPIRLHRLGLSSHHGVRHRFRISDPVYTSFGGARMTAVQQRA